MEKTSNLRFRLPLGMAAVLSLIFAAGVTPAAAQAADAADRCTPDVMRLCSEAIPDADRIVACLKVKRKQLSPDCLKALTTGGPAKSKSRKKRTET